MAINKNSPLYQGLRKAYYMLWRQNPHVYRFLLPLRLLSAQTNENKCSRISFSPRRIKSICLAPDSRRNDPDRDSGHIAHVIQSGDWDQRAVPVSETWIYKYVRRLMREPQADPAEPELLRAASRSNAASLDRKLAEESGGSGHLMEMVKAAVKLHAQGRPPEEIIVCVGRHGEILCAAHASSAIALSIATLSDCSELTGIIAARHKSWQQIRKKFFVLANSAFSEGHGSLYQQLWHPDLKDVPHLHKGDNRSRFIVAAAREGQAGAALDIGANLGFFCHQLEDLGFSCRAVEKNAVLVDYMRLLRDIEGKKFDAVCGDILGRGLNEICSQKYDLVLALAIFHHFLKQKRTYESLKRLLGKLQMERMVLQTHNPEESQMRAAYMNLEPEAFADHIIEISCLTRRQLMGKTPEGRHVFLLSKS